MLEAAQTSRSQLNNQIVIGAEAILWEADIAKGYDRRINRLMKRAVDLALASAALILLALPMLLIALLIRLDSRGRAIFKQARVGRRGQQFTFYKFRTMRADNDDAGHRAYVAALITGDKEYGRDRQHKITDDARVTRIGRWLRLTSIDELMQLFNVVKGEMSLVGPRPPLPYEVELYNEHQRRRLLAKPGITGPWQVSGRTKVGFSEMIELDLKYIRRWSIWLDLAIIARTIPALVKTRGW